MPGGSGGKGALMAAIVREISGLPRLDPAWRSLSLVYTIEEGVSANFGYCYTGDGPEDWSAFSSTSDDLDQTVIRLRELMLKESGAVWHQALFQLVRSERRIRCAFAHGEEAGWKVTPRNLAPMISELRPKS